MSSAYKINGIVCRNIAKCYQLDNSFLGLVLDQKGRKNLTHVKDGNLQKISSLSHVELFTKYTEVIPTYAKFNCKSVMAKSIIFSFTQY